MIYCLISIQQPQITVNLILKLISGAFVASKESVSLQFPEGRFYEPIGWSALLLLLYPIVPLEVPVVVMMVKWAKIPKKVQFYRATQQRFFKFFQTEQILNSRRSEEEIQKHLWVYNRATTRKFIELFFQFQSTMQPVNYSRIPS